MALIRCPECGRENVSDTAYSCPNCGYAIRDHFIELKNREANLKQHKKEIEALKLEMEEKLNEIDKSLRPYKPTWDVICVNNIKHSIAFSIFLIISILYPIYLIREGIPWNFPTILIGMILLEAFSIFMTCLFFSILKFFYDVELKKFNEWEINKEFKRKTIQIKYENYINNLIKYGDRNGIEAKPKFLNPNSIYCPKCGSTSISTGARGVNWTLGLIDASKTVNRCANCGHMWEPRR